MSNPAFKFDHVHIISKDPEASANWYVEMLRATIAGASRKLCRGRTSSKSTRDGSSKRS